MGHGNNSQPIRTIDTNTNEPRFCENYNEAIGSLPMGSTPTGTPGGVEVMRVMTGNYGDGGNPFVRCDD